MSMLVRDLIEHLAQFEPDLEIRIRGQNDESEFYEVESHAVEIEQDDNCNFVVVIG